MKKLNKVAIMFAVATVAGSAFAAGSTINSDNWRNGHGNLIWKNGTNELCWRDAFWTPATAAPGCDGALELRQDFAARPLDLDLDIGVVLVKVLGGLVEHLHQGLAFAEHAPVDDSGLARRLPRGLGRLRRDGPCRALRCHERKDGQHRQRQHQSSMLL